MSVKQLFARLTSPELFAPISTPDLQVPIQGELCVKELERLAAHANESIAAMELRVGVLFRLLVTDLRAQAPSMAQIGQWTSNARERFITPMRRNDVYASTWELQVAQYAMLLSTVAMLCSRFGDVAKQFAAIEERLASLHHDTDTLIERAIKACAAHRPLSPTLC